MLQMKDDNVVTENIHTLPSQGFLVFPTGVENGMFWSEIGSGFGEPGGTPLPRIPMRTPRTDCSSLVCLDFFSIETSPYLFSSY